MPASFIARRYLFSPKSRSVINLIAALSVAAVAIPVAAMIVLLSVFNGFDRLLRQSHSLFDADLLLAPRVGQVIALDSLDASLLDRLDGVEEWAAQLEQQVLLEHAGQRTVTTLRGVDDRYMAVVPLDRTITYGEGMVRLGDLERLIMGETLAVQLGIRSLADADVRLYAVRRGNFSTLLPIASYTTRTVPVGGMFRGGNIDETGFVLASLRLAQGLFDREGMISSLIVRCNSEEATEAVRQRLEAAWGDRMQITTRDERHASLYRLARYEKWGIFFIGLLVLIVASFSVVGALTMLMIEKRNDRATLRALGATEGLLRSIFLREGLLICGLGGAIGLVLGVGLSLVQQHFGLIRMPADSFMIAFYPVDFRLEDLLLVVLAFAPVAWCLSELTVRNRLKREKDNL